MLGSSRVLGTAVGFGFGVVWMTVGAGSAILVLLCAALGFGVAFVAERERAGSTKLRPASETDPIEDLLVDDFELEHFERRDADVIDDVPAEDERVPVAVEADYGWPHG